MPTISFDEFCNSLSDLAQHAVVSDEARETVEAAASALQELPVVDRAALGELIRVHPEWVPTLGACIRLSQEALQNQLRARTGSSGWVKKARAAPLEIICALDEGYNLVEEVLAQRQREWSFADILLERQSSRSRAAGSILRGRSLEDEVQAIVAGLGLEVEMRGRFIGRGGDDAPCDVAIPRAGADALIVGSAKGFNSTGSKLTDAVREVEEMADVRLPRQFVFAFVDGIGWLRRAADLRRIYDLWAMQSIDGLYSLAHLDQFRQDLGDAARRLGLL
jgi:hypothetical protein